MNIEDLYGDWQPAFGDESVLAEFELGMRALIDWRWEDAKKTFQRFVTWHPEVPGGWANLSIAYGRLGETSRQLTAATRAYALAPGTPGVINVLLEALLSESLAEAAAGLARSSIKVHPNDRQLLEAAAKAFAVIGRHKRSLLYACRAIDASPFFNSLMYNTAGDALFNLRKYDKALEKFEAVLGNTTPTPSVVGFSPTTYAAIGRARVLSVMALRERTWERWTLARDAALDVVHRDEGDVEALLLLAVAYRYLTQFESGLEAIERAIVSGQRTPPLVLQRALLLMEINRVPEAIQEFDFVLNNAIDPHSRREAMTYKPVAYLRLGDEQNAVASADEAIAAGVHDPAVRNVRAVSLISIDIESAEIALKEILESNPNDPVILANLGWIAMTRGDYDAADSYIDRGIEIVETNPWWGNHQVFVTKFLCLLDQGRNAEIEDYLLRVRSALSRFPRILDEVLSDMQHVGLQRELGVAQARIQELETTTSTASGHTVHAWERRLEAFQLLIDEEDLREEHVKQFLKAPESRFIFGLNCVDVITEHQLGSEFKADFVLRYANGDYVLVEIENPRRTLYTTAGNQSAALTHARQQVEDWQQWMESNSSYARTRLPGISSPEGLVIIGRDANFTDTDRERLRRTNINTRGRLRVVTSDHLIEEARAVLRNLTPFGSEA